MNTTYLLNHYRTTIVDDKLAIQILARLYKDGPKTEEELRSILNPSERHLDQKLTQMYRANFIQIITPERWAITDLSEEVLVHLGITQVAAKSLLAAQDIPESDLVFLNACIESKEDSDLHWSIQQTALLKSISNIVHVLRDRFSEADADRMRLTYAIIVGLDPDIQRLGEQDYCRVILDKQRESHTDLPKYLEIERYFVKCAQAVKDVQSSNQLLLHGGLSHTSHKQTAYSLTWARVLNALLTDVGDDGLQLACRSRKDAPYKVWKSLSSWLSNVEEISLDFLWSAGKLKRELTSIDDKHALLQMMLWEIIRRRNNIHHDVERFDVLSSLSTSQEEVAALKYGSLLMRMLLLFKSELVAGEYDNISNSQKENICKLLDDVGNAFRKRLIDNKTESDTSESATS
jgi:hypothetical protein